MDKENLKDELIKYSTTFTNSSITCEGVTLPLIKNVIDNFDDTPTAGQAWKKIAEKYDKSIANVEADFEDWINSGSTQTKEKQKIPQFVAKEIPSAPKEALDCYYNPGVYIIPPYSYKVITWIEGHFDIFLQALVNGFEIQKEPAWVVKINEKLYFCRFTDKYFEKDSNAPTYIESGSPSLIKKFTNKDKAQAVAILVDGTVKEWSE
ncbi:DUF1642 domain-containing protein [Tetragenococcus halophilus]|uniref:DUF1642 domain-containing protein n=1 Tax=Tetragenococcus halophilus TaxID=51669 RepID=UPI0030C92B4B